MTKRNRKSATASVATIEDTTGVVQHMIETATELSAAPMEQQPEADADLTEFEPSTFTSGEDAELFTEEDDAVLAAETLSPEALTEAVAETEALGLEALEGWTEIDTAAEDAALESEIASGGDEDEELEEDEATEEVQSLEAVTASFDDETVETMAHIISDELTERENHETIHGNPNIQSTLKKARNALVNKRAAKVMLAANVDPAFINRSVSGSMRYNVYALGKLADLIRGLTGDQVTNAVNIACMKSLFAFRRADVPFTGEIAKAAVSDKIRISDPKIRALLVRHTVSASTASTQACSTMAALGTLGIVRIEGSRVKPTYHLVDGPLTRKLEEVLFPEQKETIAA